MKVVCPKCAQAIPVSGVNVAEAVAYCAACAEAFPLAAMAAGDAARVVRPDRTRAVLERGRGRLAITFPRGEYKGVGLFLFVFGALWNGGVWTFALPNLHRFHLPGNGFDLFSTAFDLVFLLFPIPFILAGIVIVGLACFCVWGSAALIVEGPELLTEFRLFGLKYRWRKAVNRITTIQRCVASSTNGRPTRFGIGIFFSDATKPFVFGSNLSVDEQAWLISELQDYLKGNRSAS